MERRAVILLGLVCITLLGSCQSHGPFTTISSKHFLKTRSEFINSFIRSSSSHHADESQQTVTEKISTMAQLIVDHFGIPGLAVAVVKDNKVVLSRGFGTVAGKGSAKVDEHTNFFIGSTSKAFTSALLGQLVDQGKLHPHGFDSSVRDVLCGEEALSKIGDLTFTDLLSHRTGQPDHAHELAGICSGFSRTELVERTPFAQSSAPLRTRFQYSNTMFMVAGNLAARIAGQSGKCTKDSKMEWEDLVRSSIFKPLGMDRTFVDVKLAKKAGNLASPFVTVDRATIKKITPEDAMQVVQKIGPAGSILSNAHDIAKWMHVHLNKGAAQNGHVLLKNTTLEKMHTGATSLSLAGEGVSELIFKRFFSPIANENVTISMESYGLGWIIENYRGYRSVWHNGAVTGMNAQCNMIPSEKIGVVVYANRDSVSHVLELLARYSTDLLLGVKPWISEKTVLNFTNAIQPIELVFPPPPLKGKFGPHPALPFPLQSYVGKYNHPYYGKAEISVANRSAQTLLFVSGPMKMTMSHIGGNIFEAKGVIGIIPLVIYPMFSTNILGYVDRVSVQYYPAIDPIVYTSSEFIPVGEAYNNAALGETCYNSQN